MRIAEVLLRHELHNEAIALTDRRSVQRLLSWSGYANGCVELDLE